MASIAGQGVRSKGAAQYSAPPSETGSAFMVRSAPPLERPVRCGAKKNKKKNKKKKKKPHALSNLFDG